MSKTTTAGMDSHLLEEVTSLATCWRITRTDGVEFFFTDHDVDITFDGNTYGAETGYKRTAIQNDSTMAVDNLNLEGIFSSTEITEQDLRAGLFDFAQVRIFIVNWDNLVDGDIKMRNGKLGEVTLTTKGVFRVELRGLTQALSQRIGEVYQAECRADLGDNRCKVPVDPPIIAVDTTYVLGAFVRVSTTAGTTQEQYENRIYEVTVAGPSGDTEPTFDTTIGNVTVWSSKATGVLTVTGNFSNGNSVRLDGKIYTLQTTLTDVDGNVLIGATASDSLDNLVAAVVLGAGAGTLYATSTTLHPDITATVGAGDTVDFEAKVTGSAGNLLTTIEFSNNGSFAADTLTGGSDLAFTARDAWMRHATVATVVDRKVVTLTVTESRAVDDWFNGGALEFEDGDNNNRVLEIRDWVQSTSTLTLFLPTSFDILVGAKVRLYPGCDKRSATCIAKFVMAVSLNFANGNMKNYRGEPFVPGQDELTRYPDAKSG